MNYIGLALFTFFVSCLVVPMFRGEGLEQDAEQLFGALIIDLNSHGTAPGWGVVSMYGASSLSVDQ